MRSTEIVTLANRPDLAPTVADWIWREWSKRDGYSFEETLEYVAASSAGKDIPQTFVLLVDGEPVGTSSLVAADMKERPNLTPWMASVFVVPTARRRGHVIPLIRTIETAAVAAGIPALWLHTDTAACFPPFAVIWADTTSPGRTSAVKRRQLGLERPTWARSSSPTDRRAMTASSLKPGSVGRRRKICADAALRG